MDNPGFDSADTNGFSENKSQSKSVGTTLEDAISHTGTGKFHYFLVFLSGGCLLCVSIESLAVSFVAPLAKCEFGFSNNEQGILNSASFIGVVVMSLFWGLAADTWGRVTVMRISLISTSVFSFISAFSVSTWMLIVLRILVGMTISGTQATALAYLGEFYSNKGRSMAITIASMFMPVGVVLLPIMALSISDLDWSYDIGAIDFRPWRIIPLTCCAFNLFFFAAANIMPESPKFLLVNDKQEEAIEVLRMVFKINNNLPPEVYDVKSIIVGEDMASLKKITGIVSVFSLIKSQTMPLLKPPHLKNTLGTSFMMFVLFAIAHGTFMWFPDILTRLSSYVDAPMTMCAVLALGNRNITNAATDECVMQNGSFSFLIITIMGAVICVVYFIMAFVINCIDVRRLAAVWLVISGAVGICLNLTDNFYVIVVMIIIFLSCGCLAGALSVVGVELFPTCYRATALCLMFMFARLGAVAGSNIMGAAITTICDSIFIIFGSLTIASVLLLLLIGRSGNSAAARKISA